MLGDKANIPNQKKQYVPTKLNSFFYEVQILERNFILEIIKMKDSILIYVNENDDMQFNDFSMAVIDRYNRKNPIGTQLLGDFNEETSKNISSKLAKKLGMVVFLSFNIKPDRQIIPLLEKKISEQLDSVSNLV